jgi:hypothetical protein
VAFTVATLSFNLFGTAPKAARFLVMPASNPSVTPSLKSAISAMSLRSWAARSPLAICRTRAVKASVAASQVCPVRSVPASKSIQFGRLAASSLPVETFTVGTTVPNGVPRPVLNRII